MVKWIVVLLGGATLTTSPVGAAEQVVSGGRLAGANGVMVNGQSYDVRFIDGTCAAVFGSCSTTRFTFTTRDTAEAAAQSLLDQVFLDTAGGSFDTVPSLTTGCTFFASCQVHVPYSAGISPVATMRAVNATNDLDDVLPGLLPFDFDTTSNTGQVYARFTASPINPDPAAVPEPAGWTLMIGGLGVVGGGLRRGRPTRRPTVSAM